MMHIKWHVSASQPITQVYVVVVREGGPMTMIGSL